MRRKTIERLGSSRVWAFLLTTVLERSKSVPGFDAGAGTPLEREMKIDPVEEEVAILLAESDAVDIVRARNGYTFENDELEACFQRYFGLHFGEPHSHWKARLVFVAIFAVLISVTSRSGLVGVVLSLTGAAVSMLCILITTLLCKRVPGTKVAPYLDAVVILPTFVTIAAMLFYGNAWNRLADDSNTLLARAELVLTCTSATALYCMRLRPLDTLRWIVLPSFTVTTVMVVLLMVTSDASTIVVRALTAPRALAFAFVINSILVSGSRITEQSIRHRYLYLLRVRAEKKRSLEILLRLLPETVIARMRSGTTVVPTTHMSASIMFVEIDNFDIDSQHAPHALTIGVLNRVFNAFDGVVAAHNAYKVESVGPVYMVAANVLTQAHEHAAVLLSIAKAFHGIAARRHMPTATQESKQMLLRIGIHTGPFVSGVIERKLPRYRLFGDTVNTASRMCSLCPPGGIQLSADAMSELVDYGHPDVLRGGGGGRNAEAFSNGEGMAAGIVQPHPTPRGVTIETKRIVVKGKGEMDVHIIWAAIVHEKPLLRVDVNSAADTDRPTVAGLSSSSSSSSSASHQTPRKPPLYTKRAPPLAIDDNMRASSFPSPQQQSLQVQQICSPLQKQYSAMWGDARSPLSSESPDLVLAENGSGPSPVVSGRASATPPPPQANVSTEGGLHPSPKRRQASPIATTKLSDRKRRGLTFKMEESRFISMDDKVLSAQEMELPDAFAASKRAHNATMKPTTLTFVKPPWLESAFVNSTRQLYARAATHAVVGTLLTALLCLVTLIASLAFRGCAVAPIRALAFLAAVASVNAAALLARHRLTHAAKARAFAAVVIVSGLATAVSSALLLAPSESPLHVSLCDLNVSESTAVHFVIVVVAFQSSGVGVLFVNTLTANLLAAVSFVVATKATAADGNWVIFAVVVVASGYVHSKERALREDFLATVAIHIERRAFRTIACHLLPPVVVDFMCKIGSGDGGADTAVASSSSVGDADQQRYVNDDSPTVRPSALLETQPLQFRGFATGEHAYSSRNTDVAILYADIVEFTTLCASLTPQTEVVTLLRTLFAAVDNAAGKHGVCKIETIGDAYWAAANLPTVSGNDGDDAIVGISLFALELHDIMATFSPGPAAKPLRARIGISYGEVATGVVGQMSPRYHAFGPVVVKAQSLEKLAAPTSVLVTPEFSLRLQLAIRRRNMPRMYFTSLDSTVASSPLVMTATSASNPPSPTKCAE